ncbi:pseudouridine synthase [Texcoconibacillus texcoconensis]|nr:pseudouridine synthase [Texcoconibacillus texcoconensis]
MRLDKLLANSGFGTRKEVKKTLKKGGVTVDGIVAKDGKMHVDPDEQEVKVFGVEVEYKPYIYLMMNKPDGLLSATEDINQETVIDILEPEDVRYEPFPVGRLDKDTTGLLLITNDGKFAHQLTSPKRHVPKKYRAWLAEPLKDGDIEAFQQGIELDDGYVTKPAELCSENENGDVVEVTIYEGKYHQVKRMFAARRNRVVRLKREAMGSLQLDEDLEPGEYRDLTEEEYEMLKAEA